MRSNSANSDTQKNGFGNLVRYRLQGRRRDDEDRPRPFRTLDGGELYARAWVCTCVRPGAWGCVGEWVSGSRVVRVGAVCVRACAHACMCMCAAVYSALHHRRPPARPPTHPPTHPLTPPPASSPQMGCLMNHQRSPGLNADKHSFIAPPFARASVRLGSRKIVQPIHDFTISITN